MSSTLPGSVGGGTGDGVKQYSRPQLCAIFGVNAAVVVFACGAIGGCDILNVATAI